MASETVVFITGAGRGLGATLVQSYLQRPNHRVIGSVRDESSAGVAELKKSTVGDGSSLLLVKIDSSSVSDPENAVKELEKAGIDHVDIVIANAAFSPPVLPLEMLDFDNVTEAFAINALGPAALFKALGGLLEKSKAPKWVSVSSAVGSLACMEVFGAHVAPAYGMSKAGLNWVTMAAHCGNKWLVAFAVHPGLVQTDSGNAAAKLMGLEQAPDTKEKSAGLILEKIDKATREETSGKFFNVIDGAVIPW